MQVWLAGELIIRAEHLGLSSLPPQLFLKTTIRKLILTGNQLDSLPVELFQLRELRELRVGHNLLTYLPEEVQCLQQLNTLDLQHNQLKLVPASLFKCVHLKLLNLNSNPLCSWLRELWPELPAEHSQEGEATAGSSKVQESPAVLQQLKANTRALLDHLLQAQEPEVQQQVQQARLAVLQSGSRARVSKLLLEVDLCSLAECHRIATTAQLSQDVLSQVQQRLEAAEALQAAADKVQQQQQQGQGQEEDGTDGVPADLQLQLAACLRRVEELCKPAKPAGRLYTTAHDLLRKLQRHQQERGWRCCATPTANDSAAIGAACDSHHAANSTGPRRFLTSAERVRQKLAVQGAKTHEEWLRSSQQEEERQKQLIRELARAEVEGRAEVVALRAAKAVQNCDREQHWPSRRVEAYPPGTFSLSPQVLKAVRRAYHRTPPLPPAQDS